MSAFHRLLTLTAMAPPADMNFNIRIATGEDVGAMHRLRNSVRENRLSGATRISEAPYIPYIAAGSACVAGSALGITGFAAIDAADRKVWAFLLPLRRKVLG